MSSANPTRDVVTGQLRPVTAIIVDSRPGERHLDTTESSPTSLASVKEGTTVLDWSLHALREVGITNVTYVGGYHIQKVMERYPHLNYRFHADWRECGELIGTGLAECTFDTDVMLIRSGTICIPTAIHRLVEDDQAVQIATCEGEDKTNFAGLVAIPQQHVARVFELIDELSLLDRSAGLEDLVAALLSGAVESTEVTVDGLAAPVHDRNAVSRTVFGGKGRTLEQIKPLVTTARVLDQLRFTVPDWIQNPGPWIKRIQDTFQCDSLVVRSNAHGEDGIDKSSAGAFHSVLNVDCSDPEQIFSAVRNVIDSYGKSGRIPHELDEVLVQPQVFNLRSSGVMLTRDMETGAPYYAINIDRSTGRSDSVTSGAEAPVDTFYVAHEASADGLDEDVQKCVCLARELVSITGLDSLDIEFGIGHCDSVYLFQIRPLAGKARRLDLADDDLYREVDGIKSYVATRSEADPSLDGSHSLYGTMPDWNPAEMIGTAPRTLALSLYQHLIGNDAWAAARAAIGYRDCRPTPLIVSLGGRPYVDVRASLNSFLPADVESDTAQKWVEHNLKQLEANREWHDKIEFEVAVTCHACDFEVAKQRMQEAGLTNAQIETMRASLLSLTDKIISGAVAPLESQMSELDVLANKRARWQDENQTDRAKLARAIHATISDCERHGTVPFSILARYGFMAVSFMRSLKRRGIFSDQEYETLLSDVPTVASDLSRDMAAFANGDISEADIVRAYGHLRPSSYDITSPNYASAISTYLSTDLSSEEPTEYPDLKRAEALFMSKSDQIGALLEKEGFQATPAELCRFVVGSVQARERAKFEFTKSLNSALELIAAYGSTLGYSRDDMSFVEIETLLRSSRDSECTAMKTQLRRTIEFNRKRMSLTSAIRLPHLICSLNDIEAFRLEEWQPNFITTKRVSGEPIVLSTGEDVPDLDGRIVMIRAADPGYDWIFGHAIAGLVTQFGGVASHMAIRAAEFGLPAAIGCGEVIFERLRGCSHIELDCASKIVRGIDDRCGFDASDRSQRVLRTA